jgi:uracil-DNA glycosylase family 4
MVCLICHLISYAIMETPIQDAIWHLALVLVERGIKLEKKERDILSRIIMDILHNLTEYEEMTKEIRACERCDLGCEKLDGYDPHVPGQGNIKSKIMFIAEAPGLQETIHQRPLTPPGTSGKIYEKTLDFLGLTRDQVFSSNVCLCRPPKNRDPEVWEVHKCKKYFKKTLEIVGPDIIVSFGRFAATALLGRIKITKDHGILTRSNEFNVDVFPLFHPAYIGAYAPAAKRVEFKEDVKKLKELLAERGIV